MADVFISHAREDKAAVARPVADGLIARGYDVWYDEFTLRLGDSLPSKIDEGLASCRYAVVILSPSFIAKQWTKRELEGLVARETQEGAKRILPIWHNVTADQVAGFSLTISSRLAVSTAFGLEPVIEAVVDVLGAPAELTGRSKHSSSIVPIGDAARSLAEALERAREYLRPQPLSVSEAVAEAVRRSFSQAGLTPTLAHVGPYLASPDGAYRVVGYLATQVAAQAGADVRPWTLELSIGLGREQQEAREHVETRPLWQLLVAIGYLIEQNPSHPDRDYLRNAMIDTRSFLQQHSHIDPEGQCKWRLEELLGRVG